MVFQHTGAQDFDLGGGFHYADSYPMVFQHTGAQDFDLGGGFHYSRIVTLWCFNTLGRKILTLGEGFTTQVVVPYGVSTHWGARF